MTMGRIINEAIFPFFCLPSKLTNSDTTTLNHSR